MTTTPDPRPDWARSRAAHDLAASGADTAGEAWDALDDAQRRRIGVAALRLVANWRAQETTLDDDDFEALVALEHSADRHMQDFEAQTGAALAIATQPTQEPAR